MHSWNAEWAIGPAGAFSQADPVSVLCPRFIDGQASRAATTSNIGLATHHLPSTRVDVSGATAFGRKTCPQQHFATAQSAASSIGSF